MFLHQKDQLTKSQWKMRISSKKIETKLRSCLRATAVSWTKCLKKVRFLSRAKGRGPMLLGSVISTELVRR